ncbi:MAG: relaxase/mobilization nuclease domain-containing protein [Endozoicomonadaceae bacterium]|nr:relaxase/mobilization nuclease domain-containing protein [Endozoicomonadaceae bacterium]
MHIKHLKHGTGSAKKAAEYMLHDTETKLENIKILRGDPMFTALVADSLEFKHKYTSGVISWHLDDNPTDEQIQAVLSDYEALAFAGLNPEQYSFSAVQHRDEVTKAEAEEGKVGAVHIHTFAARVELESGKSFNPVPPGALRKFDLIRNIHNLKNEWKQPDDPLNARAINFERMPEKAKDAREYITEGMLNHISKGLCRNRIDIINELKARGFSIVRTTQSSISVKDKNNRNLRLKGRIYECDFDSVTKIFRTDQRRFSASQKDKQQRIKRLAESYQEELSKRRKYNIERYTPHNESSYEKQSRTVRLDQRREPTDIPIIESEAVENINDLSLGNNLRNDANSVDFVRLLEIHNQRSKYAERNDITHKNAKRLNNYDRIRAAIIHGIKRATRGLQRTISSFTERNSELEKQYSESHSIKFRNELKRIPKQECLPEVQKRKVYSRSTFGRSH